LSDRGRVRSRNEDSLVVEPSLGLFAVCDGMGGHVGGAVASQIAADTLLSFVRDRGGEDWPFGRQEGLSPGADLLRNATLLANRQIAERITKEPWLARMGTTMVTALVGKNGHVDLAHVGDSRAYLWRAGVLRQITTDHSWVNEQVQQGVLTRTEAERHPLKNVITRALGSGIAPDVDLVEETMQPGDVLLLCSDGLTGMLTDTEITAILKRWDGGGENLCRLLVEAAVTAGGEDNVTVAVVLIPDPPTLPPRPA
jgi:protein phosphatase